MNCVDRAVVFAVKAHQGKLRKGKTIPYIIHLMETAAVVAGMTDDLQVIAAALLHDSIEDTYVTFEDIKAEFGSRVAALVAAVTEKKRPELPPEETWRIRKQETIDSLNREQDSAVKMLVVGDKLSNMRAIYRDYLALGDKLWEAFHEKDHKKQAWYYRSVLEATAELNSHPAWQEYKELWEKVFS